MTFLPIVMRELRVAARKRRTFWLRIVAALVALLIGGGIMILSNAGAIPLAELGTALFSVLTWLCLFAAGMAGLFFTADCLSEEKREGTLGFLFLTDLRGYDVTGGKLLATSLRASFALLAVFPILALTLTMGGVTGAEFWKTSLAVVNMLICSLMAGLFVSSISQDSQKALSGTLLLLVGWMAAGPILDNALAWRQGTTPDSLFSLSSPLEAFSLAGHGGPYWMALLASQGTAWTLFAVASVLGQRTWQDKRSRVSSGVSSMFHNGRYGGVRRREKLRLALLDLNPVTWLLCRERSQSFVAWAGALLLSLSVLIVYSINLIHEATMLWRIGTTVGLWILYLWAASQSNRFHGEARQSGMMELLLATPLSVREIIDGQWRALARTFGAPILLILAIALFGSLPGDSPSWARAVGRTRLGGWPLELAMATVTGIATVASLAALLWTGMWLGLTSKNFSTATLKTLACVQIIPSMLISFVSAIGGYLILLPMLMNGSSRSTSMVMWLPLLISVLSCWLTIIKDFGFIVWARHRLYASFREQASRSFSPAFNAIPQRIRPTPPPPIYAGGPFRQ